MLRSEKPCSKSYSKPVLSYLYLVRWLRQYSVLLEVLEVLEVVGVVGVLRAVLPASPARLAVSHQ